MRRALPRGVIQFISFTSFCSAAIFFMLAFFRALRSEARKKESTKTHIRLVGKRIVMRPARVARAQDSRSLRRAA